ncbi:MAG TPA: galactokinase [Gemmatimonadaceae bacterium]|nr:galactokinase [Gemmatimonadaceae bacterium]
MGTPRERYPPVRNELRARVLEEFQRRFDGKPSFLVRAPGRVNLIGDHTDYNDGFVLPMAIDREIWLAVRPRADRRVGVHSIDLDEDANFALDDGAPGRSNGEWVEYLRGVARALEEDGRPTSGWDGIVAGDVPVGAGLSSSAALELATARAFAAVSGVVWQPVGMARVAQRAENEWVGVNCGIMDQLVSAAGAAGHALLIDCRTLETRSVAIPASAAVVILDTGTRRGLVDSAYNERRAQCEQAARAFGVPALRDVDLAMFDRRQHELDPVTRRRARHVVTEDERTTEAAARLEKGDVVGFGALMDESHISLRDDFEVSRPELDTMVELAQDHGACFGSRMTGAGFGGCAVALVARDDADDFVQHVSRAYETAQGLRPTIYVCEASAGASIESIE